jgi:hypothetical protein
MRKYRSDQDDDIIGTSSSTGIARAVTPPHAFLQHMMDYEDEQEDTSLTEETIDEEFNSYVNSVPKRAAALDPLKFWEVSAYNFCDNYIADIKNNCKTNRETFPTIFKIALDYLPIQASSVPCERVFSSSGETDTNKRNRIKHDFFEALQILKFGLKKERLNFSGDLLTTLEDLTGESPELVGKDAFAECLKKRGRGELEANGQLFSWDDEE